MGRNTDGSGSNQKERYVKRWWVIAWVIALMSLGAYTGVAANEADEVMGRWAGDSR